MLDMFAVVTIGAVTTQFHAMFTSEKDAKKWMMEQTTGNREIIEVRILELKY